MVALEQHLLLDSPMIINPMVQPGSSGIDGLAVLLTGRKLNWSVSSSSAYGTLFDAPLDWWRPNITNVQGMVNSYPPQNGYTGTLVTTYHTPYIEFNQVRGTTGLAGLSVTILNSFSGTETPGEWSQECSGTGFFATNTAKDFVTSQVSLTLKKGCNTVIDDETWETGADAGEIKVNLHEFAPGSYTVTFDVVSIFKISGGGAGGSVSMTGSPGGHSHGNPGTVPLTFRDVDTITRSVTVGDSGSAEAFCWTPIIGANLATTETVTIQGHIAMTSITKQ